MKYPSLTEDWEEKAGLQPDREFYLEQAIRGLDDAIISLRMLGSEDGVGGIIEDIEILKRKIEGLK